MSGVKDLWNCRLAVERGTDYLDEKLPPLARAAMWLHLKGCRDCRVHLGNLERTAEALRNSPRPGLNEDRKRQLLEALKRRSSPK